jgi:hypothetical protein
VPGLFELEELDGEELGGNGDETDVWGTETGVFVLVEVACCSALEEGQSQLRSQNS